MFRNLLSLVDTRLDLSSSDGYDGWQGNVTWRSAERRAVAIIPYRRIERSVRWKHFRA